MFISIKGKDVLSILLSGILVALFVAATVSATTISTNISTGGTLSVTGNSTLTGVLYATSTSLFTGTVTTYGSATFGDADTDVNLFTGTLQATSTALFTSVVKTYGDTTIGDAVGDTLTVNAGTVAMGNPATTTFSATAAHGLWNLATSTTNTPIFTVSGVSSPSGRVGVGIASPSTTFEVVGLASSTQLIVGGSAGGTISGLAFGTCTYNPSAAITASSTLSTNCTSATGVRTTDKVVVTPVSLEKNLIFTSASSTAVNVIQVSVYNTGYIGPITPVSATWNWVAFR